MSCGGSTSVPSSCKPSCNQTMPTGYTFFENANTGGSHLASHQGLPTCVKKCNERSDCTTIVHITTGGQDACYLWSGTETQITRNYPNGHVYRKCKSPPSATRETPPATPPATASRASSSSPPAPSPPAPDLKVAEQVTEEADAIYTIAGQEITQTNALVGIGAIGAIAAFLFS